MSEVQFSGNYTVFSYMKQVVNSTVAEELSLTKLEPNVRTIHQAKAVSSRTIGNELAQLILAKIQDEVMRHPEAIEALKLKGYTPQEKINDYSTEVANAVVPRLDDIQAAFSRVQQESQGSSWFSFPSLSWIWGSN